jgi:hypothetical protein
MTLSVTQIIYADKIIRAFTWLSRLRRPALTAEARVQLQVSPCGICGGQSGIATVLLLLLRFSCVDTTPMLQIHEFMSPTLHNLGYCKRLNILSGNYRLSPTAVAPPCNRAVCKVSNVNTTGEPTGSGKRHRS